MSAPESGITAVVAKQYSHWSHYCATVLRSCPDDPEVRRRYRYIDSPEACTGCRFSEVLEIGPSWERPDYHEIIRAVCHATAFGAYHSRASTSAPPLRLGWRRSPPQSNAPD